MKNEEIIANLSLYERVIFKIHRKLFTKFYHHVRISIVNTMLK